MITENEKSDTESFSQRLKRLRTERDLSVRQVAELVGVPITTYREWEYGRAIIGEPYIKLAETFKIPVYELLSGKHTTRSEIADELRLIRERLDRLQMKLDSSI